VGFKGCEADVIATLKALLRKRIEYSAMNWDGDEFHSSEQNARLVAGELRANINYNSEKLEFTTHVADCP